MVHHPCLPWWVHKSGHVGLQRRDIPNRKLALTVGGNVTKSEACRGNGRSCTRTGVKGFMEIKENAPTATPSYNTDYEGVVVALLLEHITQKQTTYTHTRLMFRGSSWCLCRPGRFHLSVPDFLSAMAHTFRKGLLNLNPTCEANAKEKAKEVIGIYIQKLYCILVLENSIEVYSVLLYTNYTVY